MVLDFQSILTINGKNMEVFSFQYPDKYDQMVENPRKYPFQNNSTIFQSKDVFLPVVHPFIPHRRGSEAVTYLEMEIQFVVGCCCVGFGAWLFFFNVPLGLVQSKDPEIDIYYIT